MLVFSSTQLRKILSMNDGSCQNCTFKVNFRCKRSTEFFHFKINNLGNHCLVETLFSSFNFWTTLFSKIVPNFWRTDIPCQIFFLDVNCWPKIKLLEGVFFNNPRNGTSSFPKSAFWATSCALLQFSFDTVFLVLEDYFTYLAPYSKLTSFFSTFLMNCKKYKN